MKIYILEIFVYFILLNITNPTIAKMFSKWNGSYEYVEICEMKISYKYNTMRQNF